MFNRDVLLQELSFKALRSSGAGGQHVNKVSSKIELKFDLNNSNVFTKAQKELLGIKLATRLTQEGILILFCDESRSQHRNKEEVVKRFLKLIEDGLKVQKRRIPTKISKAKIKKRLEAKKKQAEKKQNRKKPDIK